jgi:hypothetical protein
MLLLSVVLVAEFPSLRDDTNFWPKTITDLPAEKWSRTSEEYCAVTPTPGLYVPTWPVARWTPPASSFVCSNSYVQLMKYGATVQEV